ncbi:hypothetical protein BC939DRAFT_178366 [Gamsiella multidivaricata]|uniref:uncharacterized protein n=1 Tax=Gamsiella multidivaricata TaxID=101098 RepID=UPI00221EB877|nr:uncharacterized protein BC939DRAFT_178366 [Gamsiella multidivaricata]KAI7822731.1 hypothetical protein BC939DRAFT_178366 [Gamsiella multidivaricata]
MAYCSLIASLIPLRKGEDGSGRGSSYTWSFRWKLRIKNTSSCTEHTIRPSFNNKPRRGFWFSYHLVKQHPTLDDPDKKQLIIDHGRFQARIQALRLTEQTRLVSVWSGNCSPTPKMQHMWSICALLRHCLCESVVYTGKYDTPQRRSGEVSPWSIR